jgi:hypothetical protein
MIVLIIVLIYLFILCFAELGTKSRAWSMTGKCSTTEPHFQLLLFLFIKRIATQEAELKKITVQGQPGQMVHETSSSNNQRKMDGRHGSSAGMPALQAQSPDFQSQFYQKEKKRKSRL